MSAAGNKSRAPEVARSGGPAPAITWWVATFLGTGLAPFASGTVATIATLPLYLLVFWAGGDIAVAGAAVLSTVVGIAAAGVVERSLKYHDPSEVVIDEVAGFFVTMLWVEPGVVSCAAGFLLFRALDVLKPWPASRAEKLPGGWGIMADDVICGIIANVILRTGLSLLA